MKKIIKFVFGGLFIIGALGMFAKSEIFAGLISIILGVIILPPISENLKEKFKLWNSKGTRYISYALLLVVLSISTNKRKFSELSKTPVTSKTEAKTNPTEKIKVTESGTSGVYNANGEKVGTIEAVEAEEPMDNSKFWENYSPEVKKRIHELIKNKDCQSLQNEFEIAYRNNQAQMRRTGRNNAELLDFIDIAMYKMGCYK